MTTTAATELPMHIDPLVTWRIRVRWWVATILLRWLYRAIRTQAKDEALLALIKMHENFAPDRKKLVRRG